MLEQGYNPRRRVVLREPEAGDLGWVVMRHAASTRRNTTGPSNLEGICAHIVADFGMTFDPGLERCWIAERDGVTSARCFW